MKKKKFYETEAFLKLSREWDKALEDEGFEPLSNFENGTVLNPQKFSVTDEDEIGGSNYARLCEEILTKYEFERDIDFIIFELHSEGKTFREIEAYLKHNGLREYSYRQCTNIVNRIKTNYLKMKL
jgi:hypothetical protein